MAAPTQRSRVRPRRALPVDVVAAAASVLWLLAVGGVLLSLPRGTGPAAADPLRFVYSLMAVFLPVAMIWVAAAAAKSARTMREESARLQAAIDALRRTYVEDRQARGLGGAVRGARMERKIDEIHQTTRKTETAVANLSAPPLVIDDAPSFVPDPAPEDDDSQPRLDIPAAAGDSPPPLSRARLIQALNFPDDEHDEDGFQALREALLHRGPRQVIESSQRVLSLLSEEGIFMDDLAPDPAPPAVWRRFARGGRGMQIVELGGLHDRSSLALASGRMREDAAFRAAAHDFLRRFDKLFAEFEPEASNEDIADFAETRTARAFVLLGRVTGMIG